MKSPEQKDMASAARRHYDDGVRLESASRHDNAGYHFGFAAECSVKAALMKQGIRGENNDRVLFLHFPALRETALGVAQGRSFAALIRLMAKPSFMQHWDTKMRYLTTGYLDAKRVAKWKDEAKEAIGTLLY